MEATIDWSMGSRAAALVDWGTVSYTGRRVGGSGPPTPSVERARMREDLAEVVPYSETLIEEFTGGNPEIAKSLGRMWQEETNIHGIDTAGTRALSAYVQRAWDAGKN